MLKTFVLSEDDQKSFLRPAVYDSLRQVLKFYGLDSGSQIYYAGEMEISKLVGNNASDPVNADQYTDGIYRNKLYVVPEFTSIDFNTGYSNQRRQPTERPVWMKNDEEAKIAFFPGFSGIRVEVSIVAVFNSLKLAQNMVRRINRAQSNQVADMAFSATVHMGVNNGIVDLLENIHTLLKNNNSQTPLFGDWFDQHSQVPFTTITNVAGKHRRLVVPVKFDNIGIQFSEPLIQKARKGATYGRYEVDIKYAFYFQEFTHWELEYPLNVYQDEIDEKYIPRPQPKFKEPFNTRMNVETSLIQPFTDVGKSQAPYMLKLPDHDPWVMPKEPWLEPIIQGRLALENKETQELVNIFELPGFEWDTRAKDYILRNRKTIFDHRRNPFLIRVYGNDLKVLPEDLAMDENGMVSLLRRPWMQRTYRIVIIIDRAVRDYTDDFWDTLVKNGQDSGILPSIFPEYDWSALETPQSFNKDHIRKNIHKGIGLPGTYYNIYQTALGLVTLRQ